MTPPQRHVEPLAPKAKMAPRGVDGLLRIGVGG